MIRRVSARADQWKESKGKTPTKTYVPRVLFQFRQVWGIQPRLDSPDLSVRLSRDSFA